MNQSQWIPMEIHERRKETPMLVSLKLAPVLEETHFDFQAGQHVKILTAGGREGIFAIASEPEEKRFVEFLIKDQEEGIAHSLCHAKSGSKLQMSLPFGRGYPVEKFKSKDVLLIGIGSALSPLRSVLRSILRREHQFGPITLVYGARTIEDIPFQNEFDLWSKKVDLHLAISQPIGSKHFGFVGRVTKLIPTLSFRPEKTAAFLCGTRVMQEEVTNLLEKAGVSKENIFFNY